MNIKIFSIKTTSDGRAYAMDAAAVAYNIEVKPHEFVNARETALIKVGVILGTATDLAAIVDEANGTTYYHRDAASGNIAKIYGYSSLCEHAKKLNMQVAGHLRK